MFRTFTAAALLALLSTSSLAQARQGGEGRFERADTNNDGSVTREEFLAARAGMFGKLDRNGDGYLDSADIPEKGERRKPHGGGGGDRDLQFDTNGDGKVSKDEFVNGPATIFDRADTDGNGVLDAKELTALKEAAAERRANREK